MNINFEYYKIFYVIAKNKNITKAAQELHISQPAISRVLKTMEEQIGTKLFMRKTKGVMLTKEGKELYELISREISNIMNAENTFSKIINDKSIKIAVNSLILNYLINERKIDSLLKNYTDINFMGTNNFDLLNNQLVNNLIDFAFILEPTYYQFNDNIRFKEICKLHLVFVSNSKGANINDKPLVMLNNKRLDNIYKSLLVSLNISKISKIVVDDYDSLYPLIINGYANGVLIKEFVSNELNSGVLYEIPVDLNNNAFKIGILYNVNNTLKINELLDN